MVAFVAGYALVFASLCAVAVFEPRRGLVVRLPDSVEDRWRLPLVVLFVLPVVTAWITLDALDRLRRRGWFDYRVRRRARLVGLGIGAGVVAAAGCTALLAWGEGHVPAWVIVPVCTVLAAGGAFVLIPAARAGRCILCGYELGEGGLGGRCPECGSLDPL